LTGETPFKGADKDVMKAIQTGQVSFDDPKLSNVSKPAKDLLMRLLKKDPNERYSATEVLNHPWIKCGGSVKMEI
jgi:calcium-dependent protein kinase